MTPEVFLEEELKDEGMYIANHNVRKHRIEESLRVIYRNVLTVFVTVNMTRTIHQRTKCLFSESCLDLSPLRSVVHGLIERGMNLKQSEAKQFPLPNRISFQFNDALSIGDNVRGINLSLESV